MRLLLSWVFLASRAFRFADFATTARVFETALLLVSLRNDGRHAQMTSCSINRHKGQICRTHVAGFVGEIILHPHGDADFHRGREDAVYRGAEDDQVADMYGRPEIQVVDGCGYDVVA